MELVLEGFNHSEIAYLGVRNGKYVPELKNRIDVAISSAKRDLT